MTIPWFLSTITLQEKAGCIYVSFSGFHRSVFVSKTKKNLNPESFLWKLWLLNCQQELQTKSLLPQVRKKSGRNKFLQCQGIYLESGKKWNFELIGGHSSCCDPFHNERWWHSFLLEFDVRFSTLQAHAIKFCGSIPCFLHQCPLLLTPFLLHL